MFHHRTNAVVVNNLTRASVSRTLRFDQKNIHWLVVGILLFVSHCLTFNQAAPMVDSSSAWNHQTDLLIWHRLASEHIEQHYRSKLEGGGRYTESTVAKNVVLFLGDGMGMSTITAARILKGQLLAKTMTNEQQRRKYMKLAEEGQLVFETFNHVALTKTFNLDSQVGESGACATALMSGVKANFETVGLSGRAKLDDCASSYKTGARVSSIAEWAQQEGKSTGFVTTTRITHATPAAFYAHSANRYWESDDKLPNATSLCKDIARQLVEEEPGKNLNVIMGGGLRHFVPADSNSFGRRKDGKNLVKAWLADKRKRGLSAMHVDHKKALLELDTDRVDYLLGIFSDNHLDHEVDRNKSDYGEPSLVEMTRKAVQVLKHNPNGFLLLVESGRIDHAHHLNNAYRALTDTLALEEAVREVMSLVNLTNTLLLVTADHSHVFTFGGSPDRGNSILSVDNQLSDLDQLPYTTLLYANGPGYVSARHLINKSNTESIDYMQQAAVPRRWETHGGEDVPLYASGPGAQVFHGVLDQTFIPYGISYITCIGPMKKLCQQHQHEQRLTSSVTCSHQLEKSYNSDGFNDDVQTSIEAYLHPNFESKKNDTGLNVLNFIRYNLKQATSSSSSSSSANNHQINRQRLIILNIVILLYGLLKFF